MGAGAEFFFRSPGSEGGFRQIVSPEVRLALIRTECSVVFKNGVLSSPLWKARGDFPPVCAVGTWLDPRGSSWNVVGSLPWAGSRGVLNHQTYPQGPSSNSGVTGQVMGAGEASALESPPWTEETLVFSSLVAPGLGAAGHPVSRLSRIQGLLVFSLFRF